MTKQFVTISDTHTHPWAAFSVGEGIENSRLQFTLRVLRCSLQHAKEHKLPWLFPGDLVHTADYVLDIVWNAVMDLFHEYAEVEKVLVWGNHDGRGVGQKKIHLRETILGSLRHEKNLTILTGGPAYRCHNGLTVSGSGYQPRLGFLEYGDPSDVGLYHQTVSGSVTAAGHMLAEGIAPQELYRRHRISLVGHVHHPQQYQGLFDGEVRTILVPGSPEHQNFGDKGIHGWWVGTLAEDTVRLDLIPGESPTFRTVARPQDVNHDGHYYRVETVLPGETLPDGAQAIAATPTTVEHRNTLQGVSDVEAVLEAWIKANPPEGNIPVEAYLASGRKLLESQDPIQLRNVRVAELHLVNFCCYLDEEITIEPGIHLITGQGRDFPSNGAGKTTLIGEALYWLIFGKTTKDLSADEIIRRGAREAKVQGLFRSPDTDIWVTRTRGPDGHTLAVTEASGDQWGATSVNDMTTKLQNWLGITAEMFQSLAYFSQEKLLLFSSATDGERKSVLADLIGLTAYQEAASLASSNAAIVENSILEWGTRFKMLSEELSPALVRDAQSAADRVQVWDSANKELQRQWNIEWARITREHDATIDRAQSMDRVIERHEGLVLQARARVERERPAITLQLERELQAEQAHLIEETNRKIQLLVASLQGPGDIELIRRHVGGLDKLRQELTAGSDALAQLHIRVEAVDRELQSDLRMEKHYESVRATAQGELDEVHKAVSRGLCPACKQVITAEHQEKCLRQVQDRWQAANIDLIRLQDAMKIRRIELWEAKLPIEPSTKQLARTLAHVQQLEHDKSIFDQIDNLERAREQLTQGTLAQSLIKERVAIRIKQRQEQVTNRLERRTSRVVEACTKMMHSVKERYEHTRQRAEELNTAINPHLAELTQATGRVVETRAGIQAARSKVTEYSEVGAVLEYWKTGFSKQGIQSLLVEEIATLFNQHRGQVFPLLSQGVYDVQFSTLSKTRGGELREKTEFLIFERGHQVPYAGLSGGQRRRIDIGIMLVLAYAVAKWMNTPGVLGVLLLDEVFGFLDASGAEGLVAALQQINDTIPTIYTITHDTHLQSLIPSGITVVQGEDGISRVVR